MGDAQRMARQVEARRKRRVADVEGKPTAVVDAAVEFMRLADLVRVLDLAGIAPSSAMLEAHAARRDLFDDLLPDRRFTGRWVWSYRRDLSYPGVRQYRPGDR